LMLVPAAYNYLRVGFMLLLIFLSELSGGESDGQMLSAMSSTVSTTASAWVFVSPRE
jgi:hypothetical protein